MKKILSIFAAAAVLLGLASCSGDLHDVSAVDLSKLQLKGSIFTWAGDANYCFTEDTDGSYYYEFIATASSATFAIDYTNGESDISETQKAPMWLTTYRGTALDELNKDFEKPFGESATSTLYPHNDVDCMPLALDTGATYRIIITSGPGNIGCTVKKVADAIPFAIVDDNGKSISMDATGATTFKYDFKEKTAGTLKFFVQSGTAYYAPAAETALTTTAAETAVSGTTDPADKYYTFDYDANVPYRVNVSYKKNTGTIDISIGYQFLITDNILSGSQFSDNELTWEFTSEYATAKYEFVFDESKASWGTTGAFALHNDGYGHKYCHGANVALGSDFVELGEAGENAQLTGLTNGVEYVLTFKADTEKVYAKIEAK